jgi:hypothetical protein
MKVHSPFQTNLITKKKGFHIRCLKSFSNNNKVDTVHCRTCSVASEGLASSLVVTNMNISQTRYIKVQCDGPPSEVRREYGRGVAT